MSGISLLIPKPVVGSGIRLLGQPTIYDALDHSDSAALAFVENDFREEHSNVKRANSFLPLLEALGLNRIKAAIAMIPKMGDHIHRAIEQDDSLSSDSIGGSYFHVMLGEGRLFYNSDCIDCLIKAGLDPKRKNKDGKNPLTLLFSNMLFSRGCLALQENWDIVFDFLSKVTKEDRDHLIKEVLTFMRGQGYPKLAGELSKVFTKGKVFEKGSVGKRARTQWVLEQCQKKFIDVFQKEEGQTEELAVRKFMSNGCGVPDELIDFSLEIQEGAEHTAFGMPPGDNTTCERLLDVVKDCYSFGDATRDAVEKAFHHAATMSKQVADSNKIGVAPPFLTKKYVTAVQKGDTQVMRLGWKRHAITVTFFNGYMVIGNGGPRPDDRSTLTAFKIDPKRVTKKLLEHMVAQSSKSEKEAVEFFYTELPQKLGAILEDGTTKREDETTKAIEGMSPKEQKWGNCPLFSLKAALRVVLFAIKLSKAKAEAEGVNTEEIEAIVAQTKTQTKSFSTELRVHFFLSYLARHAIKFEIPQSAGEVPELLRASKIEIQRKAEEPQLDMFNAKIALATVDKIDKRISKPLLLRQTKARRVVGGLMTLAMAVYFLAQFTELGL